LYSNLFSEGNRKSWSQRWGSIRGWHLRGGPEDGLPVEVEYIDTKPRDDGKSPVILALHA